MLVIIVLATVLAIAQMRAMIVPVIALVIVPTHVTIAHAIVLVTAQMLVMIVPVIVNLI